ncbi:MAG: hypothetical protein ACK5P5_03900 [Pseudobdellovibrionaceae bacterium]
MDLWEAKNLFKKEINVAESSVPKLVDDAFLNLKNAIDWTGRTAYFDGAKTEGPDALYSELSYLAQPFLKEDPKVSYLDNVKLTDTQDSFELIQPSEGSGCKIEQLVNYLDLENRVLVNNDLFKQMDSVQQAAVIVHESLYRLLRFENEISSIRVRRAVGLIFSGYAFYPINELFKGLRHFVCKDEKMKNVFYVIEMPNFPYLQVVMTKTDGKMIFGFREAMGINSLSTALTIDNFFDPRLGEQNYSHGIGVKSPVDIGYQGELFRIIKNNEVQIYLKSTSENATMSKMICEF